MKKYYINEFEKSGHFIIKPKIYTFEGGNKLYVFPGNLKEKRLKKAIIKSGADKITDVVSDEFHDKIYLKLIISLLKEHNINELTISLSNPLEHLNLLTSLHNREISFSLTDSVYAHETAEYFLETFGVPVSILNRVKNGIFIFENKNVFPTDKKVFQVNISKCEFYLKNTFFPIKLDTIPLLYAALELTEKYISDIIIKPCIIRTGDE